MSYEIPGFNPTDPNDKRLNVHHVTLENVGFHVVDFARLLAVAETEKVTLIDSPLTSHLPAKHLTASLSTGKNFDNKQAYFYNAAIDLRGGRGLGNVTRRFGEHCRRGFDDLQVHSFVFDSMRRLSDKDGEYDALLSYWQKTQRVEINNQKSVNDSATGRQEHRLIAPKKGDVDTGKQYLHFMRSLAAGLLVASSLDRPYRRSLTPYDFVMTPKGPLYYNPASGEWVHQLGPQKVEITPPKAEKLTDKSKHIEQPELFGAKKLEDTTLEDLYGIEEILDEIGPLIAFYKDPEAARRWGIARPGNIFVYGPPGGGKTSLVYAVGNAIDADVKCVKGTDLYGKYIGDSEAKASAIFDEVRDAVKPIILFFDEMEGLISASGGNEASRTYNAVAGIFKTEAQRITENSNVILAAASNNEDLIDNALLRDGRFDIKLPVGLPNEEARKLMLGHHIISMENRGQVSPDHAKGDTEIFRRFDPEVSDDSVLQELARLTENFSGAAIVGALVAARRRKFVREANGETVGPITKDELVNEIMRKRRTA